MRGPFPQAPTTSPPGPVPQPASRRPPPARGVRARTRTHSATAFDAKPLDAACLAVPARVVRGLRGARVTPSPTAAQVGPRPASRLIEKLAAGAAPAGATRPSTEQTGSTMSRRSAVVRPLYPRYSKVHTSQAGRGFKVWVKEYDNLSEKFKRQSEKLASLSFFLSVSQSSESGGERGLQHGRGRQARRRVLGRAPRPRRLPQYGCQRVTTCSPLAKHAKRSEHRQTASTQPRARPPSRQAHAGGTKVRVDRPRAQPHARLHRLH